MAIFDFGLGCNGTPYTYSVYVIKFIKWRFAHIGAFTWFSRQPLKMKQLNLSLKKTAKPKVVSTISTSRKSATGEVYFHNCLRPVGITNAANNCYASSVLHCLLNHPIFPMLEEQVITKHEGFCNSTCTRTGMWVSIQLYALIQFSSFQGICAVAGLKGIVTNYKYSSNPCTVPPFSILTSLKSMSFYQVYQHK